MVNARFNLTPDQWGKFVWGGAACFVFSLKDVLTDTDTQACRVYWYVIFPMTIPCEHCLEFYQQYIQTFPPDLSSRRAQIEWLYNLHNAVNVKLGKPLTVTLAQFINTYESTQATPVATTAKPLSVASKAITLPPPSGSKFVQTTTRSVVPSNPPKIRGRGLFGSGTPCKACGIR